MHACFKQIQFLAMTSVPLSLFANFGKNLGLGVLCNVVGDCKNAMRAPTLGMNNALRNPLAVLVGQLFNQLAVLYQKWGPRGPAVIEF